MLTLIYFSDEFKGQCRYELILGKADIATTTFIFVLLPLAVMMGLYAHMTVIARRQVGDHGHTFSVTSPLWGKSTGYWWIPPTKSQPRESLMLCLLVAWTSCWINNCCVNDVRRHDFRSVIICFEWDNTRGFSHISTKVSIGCEEMYIKWPIKCWSISAESRLKQHSLQMAWYWKLLSFSRGFSVRSNHSVYASLTAQY